jgi:hypothetical protein
MFKAYGTPENYNLQCISIVDSDKGEVKLGDKDRPFFSEVSIPDEIQSIETSDFGHYPRRISFKGKT